VAIRRAELAFDADEKFESPELVLIE